MDLKLKNKKCLIMGASAGIGKSIAFRLLQEGATTAICSRSQEKIEKTSKEIGSSYFFTCDLSLPEQGSIAVKTAIEKMNGLDLLVINTGGPKKGIFLEVSNEQWQTDFQNLWMSVVDSLKAALPTMQKQKFGRVLIITSLAAKEPLPGLTTSNGLRAGLAGLIKSVSSEYAQYNITFNLVLPGYTNTDRMKELNLSDEKIKTMVPAGRLGDPEEIGNLCCFLGSELAGYITGQSIAVDGGVLKSH
ncbi:MAG: SDR family oxidoreductase [Pseudobdellovibrionaceae bacterium]